MNRVLRMRLLAVLTLLIVFAAGALVGAAVERGRGHDAPPRGGRGPRGGPPPIFAEGSPFAARLNLTPAQRDTIQKIVRNDRAKADSLYRQMRPRLRARFDSTTMTIEAVLTPQQSAEWKRVREELRQRGQRGRRLREGRPRRHRADDPAGVQAPPPPS
jgi:Spy/CpxP family protein refolding chaperone